MKTEIILTPAEVALLPQRDLSDARCIVFDVLRATSTMLTALAHGARRIYPVSSVAEARLLKSERLPDALLGGEREGVRIEGFDLGNSPREYTAEAVTGRDIISTTTNGTVALRACAGAKEVLAGAWLNLDVLASWLREQATAGERLMLVCAGTGDRFALEDGLAAAGLLDRITAAGNGGRFPSHAVEYDDAALALSAAYASMGVEPLDTLRRSANGRRLTEIGLGADVEWCAATSALPWIAVLRNGALEGECIRFHA